MRRTVRKFNLNDWFEERFGPMQRVFFSFVEILVDNQPARWWLTMDVDRKNWARHNHWKGKRKWHWQQFLTPYHFCCCFFEIFHPLKETAKKSLWNRAYMFTQAIWNWFSNRSFCRTTNSPLQRNCAQSSHQSVFTFTTLFVHVCMGFLSCRLSTPFPFFRSKDLFVIRIIYSHWFVQSKRS